MVGRRSDVALAREIAHEIFADHLLGTVGSLRRGRGRVVQNVRQLAAEGRDRAGEHEARRQRALSRPLEHVEQALQVDAHAEIEVGLRCAGDHGGEMEYRGRVGRQRASDEARVGDISPQGFESRILREIGGKRLIDEGEARDLLRSAVGADERAAREQGFGELEADEAAASGDDNFHG
jgi:hypothetical protein